MGMSFHEQKQCPWQAFRAASCICDDFNGKCDMTFTRITVDPNRMNGQPCIRRFRLTVRRVVEAVALYPDRRDLQREFPELEEEDIREALAYAAANLDDKIIDLASAG
jgi:uncharacterized protein (DUF433 family)